MTGTITETLVYLQSPLHVLHALHHLEKNKQIHVYRQQMQVKKIITPANDWNKHLVLFSNLLQSETY